MHTFSSNQTTWRFLSLSLKCLFFFSLTLSCLANFEKANSEIRQDYPSFRYVGATYSTLFGAMAMWRGYDVLAEDKPKSDDSLAWATMGVGIIRFMDGTIGMFRMGEAEKMAKNNQIQDKETLKRLADNAFISRILRSSLIAANSVTFLGLYFKDDPDYKVLVYPGVIMGVISIFNMFRLSPEEKVYQGMKDNLSFDMVPIRDGAMANMTFTF